MSASRRPPAAGSSRLGSGREYDTGPLPADVTTTVHKLQTADGANLTGTLYRPRAATAVVAIAHPRMDTSHHVMVPLLCSAGLAVWAQGTRTVGNDLTLVHETALIDLAAGFGFLRDVGFDHVVALGHSGGGPLFAFYIQQASRRPGERLATTPGGRPTKLADTDLPMPDAVAFLAPHAGQGELLLHCIDPSVSDESDPLSVDPELDPYRHANGFEAPPASSHYAPEFVARYREAQRQRVARIDAQAKRWVAEAADARSEFERTGDVQARRRSLAPRIVTVYRTDADLRCVDLSLDPSDRPYGSLFGRRPDIINYGLVGFGRLTTPDAWLSTWSGLSTNAGFRQCGPEVTIPSLLVELSGDQGAFPLVSEAIFDSLGASDKTRHRVRGLHFGAPLGPGEPSGADSAAPIIIEWIRERCGSL